MIDFNIDALFLYFGDDYKINDKIVLKQPKIGDVVDYGEAQYFNMIYSFTAIPSDMKLSLWEVGIDWNEIEDFDLFILLSQTFTPDKTGIIFGDLDFSKLKPYAHPENGEPILVDKESGVVIDKLIYMRMMTFLRKLHNITPKPEKAKGKRVKEAMLDEERRKREYNKDKPFKSYLLPLISAVKVKQGYTRDYVRNMGLYEFFDDLSRMQAIDSADHLMNGMYCGMADLSKVDKKQFNWLREL